MRKQVLVFDWMGIQSMVYETRLIFDQLGIGRIDRIGEPSILGNRSSIRSDLAKKAPSRANLEDRIEVQAALQVSKIQGLEHQQTH